MACSLSPCCHLVSAQSPSSPNPSSAPLKRGGSYKVHALAKNTAEQSSVSSSDGKNDSPEWKAPQMQQGRRELASAVLAATLSLVLSPGLSRADEEERRMVDMPALRGKDYGKSRMKYPDYVETPSGLQYKDLREGSGPLTSSGDMVVIDWDGFTIGYYGRIFEARNKAKGGSFEGDDKDYYRFRLGKDKVIPAFEEAIVGMQVGGVRRIIVPPELGYPDNDFNKAGPRPTTFSGQRALDFVLKNQGLIDKTLLFDIELIKIL